MKSEKEIDRMNESTVTENNNKQINKKWWGKHNKYTQTQE